MDKKKQLKVEAREIPISEKNDCHEEGDQTLEWAAVLSPLKIPNNIWGKQEVA